MKIIVVMAMVIKFSAWKRRRKTKSSRQRYKW
jgi:hypothetical protein